MTPTNMGDLAPRDVPPGHLALVDLRRPEAPLRMTYGELALATGGVASALAARGLPPGARIAILAPNRIEHVIAYFGAMRAGYVSVPVNTKVAQETIDFIMEDAEIRLVFASGDLAPRVPAGIPVISFDDDGPEGFAAQCPSAAYTTKPMGPEDIGQMLYTSGSTGRPKGVPLSHAGQIWSFSRRPPALGERFLIAQPLFHMNGLITLKGNSFTGATTVLMPGFEARAYTQALAEWGITAVTAVPTMFARVIKETDLLSLPGLSSLKRIMLGSAPMTLGLLERIQAAFPGAVITNGYGTTEAGPGVFGPHPGGIPTPPLALGIPVAGIEVRLVGGADENEGVLHMRTPATMSGYNNLPQKTAEVLRDGWYISGDVMRRDTNGFFFFVGRADDMFVCSGENIYPGEVEKMLERHPDIQAAAVVPLPDEERAAIPVTFIVPREGAVLDAGQVKSWALGNGPAYQHPRRVLFLPELPWAGTNKVDRKALIDRARTLEAGGGWAA